MTPYPEQVKTTLYSIIKNMETDKQLYVKNPHSDFTKVKKISFSDVLQFCLSLDAGTINSELLSFFSIADKIPTASAMVQQRSKVKEEAFFHLFEEFNDKFPCKKTFNGYHLLACDGSVLPLNLDKRSEEAQVYNYQFSKGHKPVYEMHLNALYDLCERRYIDVRMNPRRKASEQESFLKILHSHSFDEKTVFIGDRGYESYKMILNIQRTGHFFLIRIKDRQQNGIGQSFSLPKEGEFDLWESRLITYRNTREVRSQPEKYVYLYRRDGLEDILTQEQPFCPVSLRFVRIKLTEDTYESLVTNLPQDVFSSADLKELYRMRWGIETSFRELKHTVGLNHFHSKKVEFIRQEVLARLVLHNFCELIAANTMDEQPRTSKTMHPYQLNYAMVISICRRFLRNDIAPPDVETLLLKYWLPVRPGRTFSRDLEPQGATSFTYRVA